MTNKCKSTKPLKVKLSITWMKNRDIWDSHWHHKTKFHSRNTRDGGHNFVPAHSRIHFLAQIIASFRQWIWQWEVSLSYVTLSSISITPQHFVDIWKQLLLHCGYFSSSSNIKTLRSEVASNILDQQGIYVVRFDIWKRLLLYRLSWAHHPGNCQMQGKNVA